MQLLKQGNQIVKQFEGDLLDFYQFHGVQLLASKFPVSLIKELHQKLVSQIYDAGEYFKIMDNEERRTFEVHTLKNLKKEQNVWILDHMMSFRYPELRTSLEKNSELIERVKEVTKYLDHKLDLVAVKQTKEPLSIELDSRSISSLKQITIPSDCVCLSLVDNNLENSQDLIQLLPTLKNLRILWIMDNPISQNEDIKNYVLNNTEIQMFNSKLTKNATQWILKYLIDKTIHSAVQTKSFQVNSLNLSDRQIFNIDFSVFKIFPNLHKICIKDTRANTKQELQKLRQLISLPSLISIQCDLELQLKIFDLYKTEKGNISRDLLVNDHNLYLPPPTQISQQMDQLHKRLFKITNCYRLADSDKFDETSIWYLNDELGSAITHSDIPQCILAPFLYAPNNKLDDKVTAHTLMWLQKDVGHGQLIERDYLNGLKQDKQRSSRLAIWYNLPRQLYVNLYKEYDNNLQKIMNQFKHSQPSREFSPKIKDKYKVMTSNDLIKQYLTLKEFEITENIEEVDIIWLDRDVSEYQESLNLAEKGVILNQFPYERCLVAKNNLANTVQSTLGVTKFLQRTYNLETELPIFIGHYFHNQDHGLDNLWISKPPNMARSMDMLVSNNLDILIRNMETGPKLVQKYITYPVKRLNRKIDLRFIVAAKSIIPLNIYIYKHFWIRTSNNQYNIDCRFREQYETHFTVMNYGKKLTQVNYPDFIQEFNKDYKPIEWSMIYEKIKELLRQTFIAAQTQYPKMQSSKARAIYGIDIMIDEKTMEPKLLEFTFSPDCNRACKFYPTFYNDLFEVLFLNKDNPNIEPLF